MSLLVIGVVGLVVVLAAAMVLRERAASLVTALAGLAFIVLALVALSALFVPGLYESMAETALDSFGVLGQIRQMDDQLGVNAVVDATRDFLSNERLQRMLELLGEQAPPVADLAEADGGPSRIVEDMLVPSLVSVLAALFRISALITSVAGMIATVALWYAASLIGDTRRLRTSLAALEERVATLEGERA